MQKIFTFILTAAAMTVSLSAFALQPEPVSKQNAVYNSATNTVTITGVAPTQTEMDWDSYIQEDLTHISYISIERHETGTVWPDNAEIARLTQIAPGDAISYTDAEVETDRRYEYRITVDVDGENSYSKYASVYTGILPAQISAFTASVADHNATEITLSITAPVLTTEGTALSGTLSLVIQSYADWSYATIHTIEDAEPGKTYTWTHTGLDLNKDYHYHAYALIGANGKGEALDADIVTGLDKPGKPENLTCTAQASSVKLTWEKPLKGSKGGAYDPENTTYTVKRIYTDGQETVVAKELKTQEYTDDPGLNEKVAASYAVTASNKAGDSFKDAESDVIVFGPACPLPFADSFSNALFSRKGWTFDSNEADYFKRPKGWNLVNSAYLHYWPTDAYLTFEPSDDDNGVIACTFDAYSRDGVTSSLVSPEIATEGISAVDVSFYYLKMCRDAMLNKLVVSVSRGNSEWETIFTSPSEEEVKDPEWTLATEKIALDNCKQIRVKFDGVRHEGPMVDIFLDDILVSAAESGIGSVAADDNTDAPAVYYTIQGIRLAGKPDTAGIYIVKRGNKTEKILVK